MSKPKEGEPLTIPDNPYGGHLAGRRWFVQSYEIERSIMGGHSVDELRNIVNGISERVGPTSSDQEASDQAARNALAYRAREMGVDPHKP